MQLKDMTPEQQARAIKQACKALEAELNANAEKIVEVLESVK